MSAQHTPEPASINIEFIKTVDRSTGTVDGHLAVPDSGWSSSDTRFLAELRDTHPGFAEHIVKCVNLHAALLKVAADSPELRAAIAKATGSAG